MSRKHKKQRQTRASQNMDPYTFMWEDAFYIYNLNDGTLFYRQDRENDVPWYNLCVKPNPFNNAGRHFCIACGSNYEKILNTVKLYVSLYDNPEEMYESLKNETYTSGKLSNVMLGYADDWWENYSFESTCIYEDDIIEYIEMGKCSKVYKGRNVKVEYTEDTEECNISGIWADWFEDFIDKLMEFNGYTKKELYYHVQEYVDISCLNEIFSSLKDIGCKGIKNMKKLNMYRWIDVLAPLVNSWSFSDNDETDINEYE